MATLTSGYRADLGYFGYWPDGGIGSLSQEIAPSGTTRSIMSGAGISGIEWSLTGDQTAALANLTHLQINGTPLPVSSGPTYLSGGSGQTVVSFSFVSPITGFSNGTTYTVDPVFDSDAPLWIGKSTALGSISSGNIDFSSSGRTTGDKLFIAIASANEAIATPSGFTEVANSPQSRGTAAAVGGIRLAVFEKTSDGTETTVAIADPGNHVYAVGFVIRPRFGGSLVIDTSAGKDAAASTSHSGNSLTTTVDNCLIVDIWATDRDSASPSYSAAANASLTQLIEAHDAGTTSGAGSGIAIHTGIKATAGSVSATTATSAASVAYCAITLALKSAAAGASLTVNNASHGHAATSPALAPQAALTVASGSHAHTAGSPGIVPKASLIPAAAAHAHAATSPTVTVNYGLALADAAHVHTATSPSLSLAAVLDAQNAAHAHAATQPTVAVKYGLMLDDAAHAHTATSPALSTASVVTPQAALHGHVATSTTVTVAYSLTPANSWHAHAATQPGMSVTGALSPGDGHHDHVATAPVLASWAEIMVASGAHQHTSTSPAGASFASLVADNAEHAHAASAPIVASMALLALDDAYHASIASEPALAAFAPIWPDSVLHPHLASSPALAAFGAVGRLVFEWRTVPPELVTAWRTIPSPLVTECRSGARQFVTTWRFPA